ncbi:MAG TPA: LuxR C-terminal-related transcriptional regulator [Polyangia bacterium]
MAERTGWLIALFAGVVALVAIDLVTDAWSGARWMHWMLELAIALAAGAGAVALGLRARAARRAAHALGRDLAVAQADAARWRQEAEGALRGLGAAIDRQFDHWQLSPAEREIALLLLKGLSLKEVAAARQTSERTVRQQALGIYRKAGLAGRAELSAFFLEDLLLPMRHPT